MRLAYEDKRDLYCTNTKIKAVGVLRAELLTKTYFVAAILKFQFLSGNRWNDVVVPAIFEFSILKNPLGQMFTLLSGSAHVKLKMLHIRSTNINISTKIFLPRFSLMSELKNIMSYVGHRRFNMLTVKVIPVSFNHFQSDRIH